MMPQRVADEKQDYFRVVAFWVICEAFAGGIIHSVKVPFGGMIISSLAVFCIIMIGKHFPGKGNIIKATLLVCVFKLMLSPHSSPTAYLAVLFQGCAGELLFRLRLGLRTTAMLLAVMALVESSIQRILVLWILYGTKFWDALDKYLEKFSGKDANASVSLQLAIGYVAVHAVTGLLVGYYYSILARESRKELIFDCHKVQEITTVALRKKKKKVKWLFLALWAILFLFLLFGYAYPKNAILSGNSALWLVFRALTIAFAWYFIVSPLVIKWFSKRMVKSKIKNQESFLAIQNLLPSTQQLFMDCWAMSAKRKGIFRIDSFLRILAVNMVPQKPVH